LPYKIRKRLIQNLKWHRRIGLGVMIMVVFLAVTGILLNHSPALDLAGKHLRANWLLSWYGIEQPALQGVQIDHQWISRGPANTLFVGERPVADCPAPLHGVDSLPTMVLALCRDTLILLTPEGEFIEKLDAVTGLPEGMTQLQVAEKRVLLCNGQKTYTIDVNSLAVTEYAQTVGSSWSTPVNIPGELAEKLLNRDELPGISVETLLLDFHSGRFFGRAGVLFVDLIGILMCVLAVTGLWAWISRRRLHNSFK